MIALLDIGQDRLVITHLDPQLFFLVRVRGLLVELILSTL